MKSIWDEVKLAGITAKNRLVRSATWEGIAKKDGSVTDEAFEIYKELAKGGVGLIITGFTSVSSDDYYFGGMMRLSSDALIPQYSQLVSLIHSYDVPVMTQLALGAFYKKSADGKFIQIEPDEMSKEDIALVINQFIEASKRARQAGFDGAQIHAAHFFFLSRFISPMFNHRKDKYGGTPENRARIIFEIMDGIRRECPGMHISIKMNSNDFTSGGLTPYESMIIAEQLSERGIDSIEVSGNNTSVQGIMPGLNEAYFMAFAAGLAGKIKTSVILVGGLRSEEMMNDIINGSKVEILSLSRPLIKTPDLPNLLKNGITDRSDCISCNQCYSTYAHQCIFNGGRKL